MNPLETLRQAANSAHDELSAAEVALLEATARAEKARGEAAKLDAAVAALSGEPPPEAALAPAEAPSATTAAKTPENTQSASETTPNKDIHDMSPEEFDAERKRRQRARQKEEMANNPLAHVKCSGCGTTGTMQQQIIQAPSGVPIQMMVCTGCGNQIMG